MTIEILEVEEIDDEEDNSYFAHRLRAVLSCGSIQRGHHIDTLPRHAPLSPLVHAVVALDPPPSECEAAWLRRRIAERGW